MLYEDETILWRFALPRAGWWRTAQRARLPIRPLSQSQIKREESLKRQAWVRSRSWSRVTSGVLRSVIGAVQYGTSKVFYKIVPHFDAQELRQYKQLPLSQRRNGLPVKRIDGTLLMGHKHLAGAFVKLPQVAKAASCPNRALHHPPKAFNGVEVVSTMGR